MPYEGAGFAIKLTKYGGPDGSRTHYLPLARRMLSQNELQAQISHFQLASASQLCGYSGVTEPLPFYSDW